MVWAAVVLGLISVASDVLLWLEHRRAVSLKLALDTEHAKAMVDLAKVQAERDAFAQRAAWAEVRYDALVEKLQIKSAQRDDGIIHAKNSGDVRRIFEQKVAEDTAKREKQQEN